MRIRGHRGKVDRNHRAIAEFFRAHGCEFESTAALGNGFPDGLVTWRRGAGFAKLALVEVKTKTGKLTPDQVAFLDRFPVWIVRNENDAKAVMAWLKA